MSDCWLFLNAHYKSMSDASAIARSSLLSSTNGLLSHPVGAPAGFAESSALRCLFSPNRPVDPPASAASLPPSTQVSASTSAPASTSLPAINSASTSHLGGSLPSSAVSASTSVPASEKRANAPSYTPSASADPARSLPSTFLDADPLSLAQPSASSAFSTAPPYPPSDRNAFFAQHPLFPSAESSFFPDSLSVPTFLGNPAAGSFRSPVSSIPSVGPVGPVGSVSSVPAFNYPLNQPLLRHYTSKPAPPNMWYTYISGTPAKGQVTIGIPCRLCGGVLGKKGNNLRFINQSTLCTISLQRREDVPEGSVLREAVITGSEKGIERAV